MIFIYLFYIKKSDFCRFILKYKDMYSNCRYTGTHYSLKWWWNEHFIILNFSQLSNDQSIG